MSKFTYFFFNGQKYFTSYHLTIFELIQYFNYNPFLFVLEYNNQVCDKESWKNIFINDHDKIEIVTIVGGG